MLSLQVQVATLVLFVFGLLLGVLLARYQVRGQLVLETIIFLPLVLPPSVIGYFLLLVLDGAARLSSGFIFSCCFPGNLRRSLQQSWDCL